MVTINNAVNNTTGATNAGVENRFLATNPSSTAGSTALFKASCNQNDAYTRYETPADQSYATGTDWSDSKSFKITYSAVADATPSSANVAMRISTSGEINYPSQPAFLAYLTNTVTNVTGDGTVYTVIYDTEVYDQGGDFNLGTSTFTAPITGKYQFCMEGLLFTGTAFTAANLRIVTTALTYTGTMYLTPGGTVSASAGISVLANMTAGDTATFNLSATDSGGKVDDASGLISSQARNWISGQLTC